MSAVCVGVSRIVLEMEMLAGLADTSLDVEAALPSCREDIEPVTGQPKGNIIRSIEGLPEMLVAVNGCIRS